MSNPETNDRKMIGGNLDGVPLRFAPNVMDVPLRERKPGAYLFVIGDRVMYGTAEDHVAALSAPKQPIGRPTCA